PEAPAGRERPRRRVSLFSDGGFILAMLAGAALLAAGYVVANYGKGDQVSAIVAKASTVPAGTTKKAAEVKKAITDEEKRRKEYKPQWLKIKGTGYGFDRQPDFAIDKAKNVIPGNKDRKVADVWKGASDLSMKVWLGHDDQFLYLRIVGTDDVQHQKLNGVDQGLWMDDSAQFMIWSKGWSTQWEFTVALGGDGKPAYAIHMVPNKQNGREKDISAANFTVRRDGNEVTYDVKFPLKTIGLTDKALKEGFRFNALLNDTDDPKDRRKCWIEIVEGIAIHKDVFASPWIKFEK
ncbi:MAG: hypothetical protein J6333_08460, partial [Planctomycetes bacterium]|nr:hypothetical protein [Planctomycetota bacterium]